MRDGYVGNVELQRRLERSPVGAMLIPEFLRHVSSDIVDHRDNWNARADAATGFTFLPDGGVKLTAAVTVRADSDAGSDAVIEPLASRPLSSPTMRVLEVEWKSIDAPGWEIHRVSARLRAQADIGEPVEVEQWRCQLFRLHRVVSGLRSDRYFDLEPLSRVVAVTSGGPSEEDVVFDFSGVSGSRPVVVGPPPDASGVDFDEPLGAVRPRTFVAIWGVKGGGELAGNTAWVGDDGTSVKDVEAYNARGRALSHPDDEAGGMAATRYLEEPTTVNVPRFEIESGSYEESTIAFTSPEGRLDLGVEPTEPVEVMAVGERPGRSGLTFELREAGGSVWHEVQDGDVIGQNNADIGGSDLSTLAVRRDYDARVKLTPSAIGDRSPIARRIGVMERESVVFVGEGSVEAGEWGFSDLTEMKGQLTEVVVRLHRAGVRDFRDRVTELFSENFSGELELRLWYGHPELARQYWLHIDSFLIDDWDGGVGGAVVVRCVSVLTEARKLIPVYDSDDRTRHAYEYANESLAAVYQDLLVGQIGLPGRRIGPGVEDETTLVTKFIEESDAKDELDRIAFLAGGGVISSQGRVKFVPLIDDEAIQPNSAPLHVFVKGTFTPEGLSPGLADRVDEAFVPWGWSNTQQRFIGETREVHGVALARLGTARINPPLRLDDETAKWIPISGVDDGDPPRTFSVLGERIARRTVESLGLGRIEWPIRSNYPLPWLEPGDEVAVEVEDFVGRDPNNTRPIRGPMIARGVITRARDPHGSQFSVWIRSYADLIPESEPLERRGIPREPQILDATVSVSDDGSTPAEIVGDVDTGSIRYLASKVARPTPEDVEAEEPVAGRTISLESLATLAAGERLWLSAIAYSGEAGEGPASEIFHVAPIQRGTGSSIGIDAPTARIIINDSDTTEESLQFSGAVHDGGTLEWRFIVQNKLTDFTLDESEWTDDPALPQFEAIPKNGFYASLVTLEVRSTADPLRVGRATHTVGTAPQGLDDDGKIREDGETDQGTAIIDVIDDAERGGFADDDLGDMEAGGFLNRSTGQVTDTTGVGARTREEVVTGTDRAVGGFQDDEGLLRDGARATSNFRLGPDGARHAPNRHNETFGAGLEDGDPANYGSPFESPPDHIFIPAPARMFVAASSASDQAPNIRATDADEDGFDLSAEIEIGGTPSDHTEGWASTQGGTEGSQGLSADGAEAFSRLSSADGSSTTFTVGYDLDAGDVDPSEEVFLRIYSNSGAGNTDWTLRRTESWPGGTVLTGREASFTASLVDEADLRAVLSFDDAAIPPLDFPSVTMRAAGATPPGVAYTTISGGSVASMTPESNQRIRAWAMEAPPS